MHKQWERGHLAPVVIATHDKPCTVARLTDAHVHFALDSCLVEWSEVPVVSGVRVAAVGQEDGHHLSVAKGTGIVERDETTC